MDLGAPIGTHTSTGQTGSAPGNFTSTPIADKFSSSNPNARQYDTTNQTTGQALQDKATEILHGHSTTTQGQGYSTSGQGYNTTSGQDYKTISGEGYNSTSGHGHSHNSTSDSYGSTGQGTTQGLKEKAENLLHGNKSGETTSHGHGHSLGESAVSGQYAGGSANALTGESHAQRTGAGVGPLGENLGGEGHHQHQHHHHHHDNTATGITAAGQGAHSSSDYRSSAPLTKETPETAAGYGIGVGAQGGAGGHYTREGEDQGHNGAALGAGAGLGAAGAYEAGHHHSSTQQGQGYSGQQSGEYNSSSNSNNNNKNDTTNGGISGEKGHYGKASDGDFDRGAPLSKDLDSGNPHSLVYQESTGKYVHRRDL